MIILNSFPLSGIQVGQGCLIKGFAREKNKIVYPKEQLEKFREAIYSLFLKVGNMKDIMDMPPWKFYDVTEFAGQQGKKNKWKPLKESQKDMIKKAKGNK